MNTLWISNGALSARIVDYGASLLDLRLAGWPHPLILGFEPDTGYQGTDHFAGAVIGRFANRIRAGQAIIDGQSIQLSTNSSGHHLHGGVKGLSRQHWIIENQIPDKVTLTYTSPAGDEGYPGTCVFTVIYSIVAPAILQLDFAAVTDAATLVNLCHHPYFNFAGSGDIGDHQLQIAADSFLWSGEDLVPTGEIRSVADTDYDFTNMRSLTGPRPDRGFNNTYCLANNTRYEPALAARLMLTDGPEMELWTTQPGLHLYDSYKLPDGIVGLDGQRYGPRQAVCLEAHGWPNSTSHSHFPSAILRPGETYRQTTQYRFQPVSTTNA